jgi:hypothetical protein
VASCYQRGGGVKVILVFFSVVGSGLMSACDTKEETRVLVCWLAGTLLQPRTSVLVCRACVGSAWRITAPVGLAFAQHC